MTVRCVASHAMTMSGLPRLGRRACAQTPLQSEARLVAVQKYLLARVDWHGLFRVTSVPHMAFRRASTTS